MIMDFTEIKQKISAKLDHKTLNDVFDFNPTAENMAEYICGELAPFCYRADVRESEGNAATYWKPGTGICPKCNCGCGK
jgi:6-pyruvoyltetrahydropterin/6-carboxytetrahydropterin synthase